MCATEPRIINTAKIHLMLNYPQFPDKTVAIAILIKLNFFSAERAKSEVTTRQRRRVVPAVYQLSTRIHAEGKLERAQQTLIPGVYTPVDTIERHALVLFTYMHVHTYTRYMHVP